MPRTRGRKRGRGSMAGRLGRKAPDITAEWGPVRTYMEPASARFVWLEATRYSGQCASCGADIPAGSRALWRPGLNRLECEDCSGSASRCASTESRARRLLRLEPEPDELWCWRFEDGLAEAVAGRVRLDRDRLLVDLTPKMLHEGRLNAYWTNVIGLHVRMTNAKWKRRRDSGETKLPRPRRSCRWMENGRFLAPDR